MKGWHRLKCGDAVCQTLQSANVCCSGIKDSLRMTEIKLWSLMPSLLLMNINEMQTKGARNAGSSRFHPRRIDAAGRPAPR
jgi:hypothetical protein